MQYDPNPESQNNIEPGGLQSLWGTGMGDVFDFDSDGPADVAVKIANGITFGDGEVSQNDNDEEEWGGVLDGRTGALKGTSPIPTDYIADGPLAAWFVVRYLDGVRLHLVAFTRN
ncbi:hypothetical protein BDW68DRAFT_171790 [Aspergillus falconensis]